MDRTLHGHVYRIQNLGESWEHGITRFMPEVVHPQCIDSEMYEARSFLQLPLLRFYIVL